MEGYEPVYSPDTVLPVIGLTNGAWHAKAVTTTMPALKVFTLADFVNEKLPAREQIMSPILPVGGLAMIYAARGVGKTHVAMGIAYAVAFGGEFLRWRAPKPRRVLYLDGEMPARLMQERATALVAASPHKLPSEDYFRLVPMDRQSVGVSINLSRLADQAVVEAHLGDAELLIIDNLSTLVNGGRENDADSWDAMQAWLLQLRRRDITVLLVHHAGRGGEARGTSKREDVLDTVIQLKRPADYEVEEGARFECHLTKARGVFGEDAMPFEARLTVADGRDDWTCTTLEDRALAEVIALTQEGLSVREIAAETGLSKSKVGRMQKANRDEGRR